MAGNVLSMKNVGRSGVIVCKKCASDNMVKSGIVAGRQRFLCKTCGCNFRVGDERMDEQVAVKKLLCVLLHFMGKDSFRALGKILQLDHTLVYRWVKEFDGNLPKLDVVGEIKEMQFDELWRFVASKKEFLSSKSLTVADGELWPGCLATVILQFSDNSVVN